jgi:hypothetical protein
MHAITEMVRQLRKGKGRNGLILANGGVLTYQHVLCLSTMRRRGGSPYPDADPLPNHVTDVPVPKIEEKIKDVQDATIEVSSVSSHPSTANVSGAYSQCHRHIRSNSTETTHLYEHMSLAV